MIEDKLKEVNGIYNNFVAGYSEGIVLAKEFRVYVVDKTGGSFLEREAYNMGAITAGHFFPLTHPRTEFRNISKFVNIPDKEMINHQDHTPS